MLLGIKEVPYRMETRKACNYGNRFELNDGHVLGHIGDGRWDKITINGYLAVEVDEVLRETEKAMYLVVDGWKFWMPKSCINMNLDETRVQELRKRTEEHKERVWALMK